MVVIGIQVRSLSMLPGFQHSKVIHLEAAGRFLDVVPKIAEDIVTWARENGGSTPLGALKPDAMVKELADRLGVEEGWEEVGSHPRSKEWQVEISCYQLRYVKRR